MRVTAHGALFMILKIKSPAPSPPRLSKKLRGGRGVFLTSCRRGPVWETISGAGNLRGGTVMPATRITRLAGFDNR